MLVVMKVEVIETSDQEISNILSCDMPHGEVSLLGHDGLVDIEVLRERVRGIRYHRPSDGKTVVIGMTEQAQNVLGLQYDAWEDLEKNRDRLHEMWLARGFKLDELNNLGPWSRILWIFERPLTWLRNVFFEVEKGNA